MIKVCFLTNIFTPYKEALLRELAKLVDLMVFYCAEKESDREWDIKFSGSYQYRILPGFTFDFLNYHLHFNRRLGEELDQFNPDVFIIGEYSYPTVMVAPFLGIKRKIPIILWSGSTELELTKKAIFTDILKRLIIRQYNYYISYTKKAKDNLVRLGAPREKVFVAPVTVDTDFFLARHEALVDKRKELRTGFKIQENEIAVIFIGQLIKRKGVDELLEAVSELGNDKIRVFLAGDGPERNNLEKSAFSLKIQDNVKFLGQQNQKQLVELYTAADVFVLSSRAEPSGNVINEAMCCALPVIISDKIGTDAVRNYVDGYIYQSGNIHDLKEKIKRLADDTGLRKKMGESGKKRLISDFSIQKEARIFAETADLCFKNKKKP